MKKLLVLTLAVAGLAACGGGDGDDESSFCDKAREVESISDEFGELADDAEPQEVRELLTRFVSSAEDALDSAPEAIEPTLAALTDGLRSIRDVLANNDYDLAAASEDPEFTELAGDPDLLAASDEFEAYRETECGITDDTATDDTATDDTATDDTATDDTATDDTATDDTATDDTVTDDTATDDTATDDTVTDDTATDGPATGGNEEGLAEQLADEFSAGSGVELTDEQRTCVGRGFIDDIGLETLASVADADDIDSGLLAQIFGILDTCGVELPTS